MAKTKKSEEKDIMNDMQKLLDTINSQYGDGSVMTEDSHIDIEKCPYGSLGLDIASGGGSGIGKWIEIFGQESSGKTTVAIYKMIEQQKKFPNKAVGIIDFENSFDIIYARSLGLDTSSKKFIISQPDYGEQGFDIAEKLITSGLVSFLCIDSIAAATPKSEMDGETGDQSMGTHARMMGKVCRKLKGKSNQHGVTMMWVNQLREKLGIMFGDNSVTTGGNAMKFYADQRIKLRKSEAKDLLTQGVTKVTARFIKNKIAPPFGEAVYFLKFGKGIDKTQEVFDIGYESGIITKTGNTYSFGETKIGVGRPASLLMLEDNLELQEVISEQIKRLL